MNPFTYQRAASAAEASTAVGAAPATARYLAGGTGLVDLMKLGVEAPELVVDINRAADLRALTWADDGAARIGAAVRMAELARDARVAERFPVLHQALLAGATPQLRHMASVGGNLLQRTRCVYFRDPSFRACNKRTLGTGCAALAGVNAEHALFGWTEACVAVHPSDLAVALVALDAAVVTAARTLPLEAVHRLPGGDPRADTVLAPGELIIAVEVPANPRARCSAYAKAPEGGFALASAAVAVELAAGRVASARVVVGGVAHRPWRSADAEAALVGRRVDAGALDGAVADAVEAALADARPLADNGVKVPLARAVLREALTQAVQGEAA